MSCRARPRPTGRQPPGVDPVPPAGDRPRRGHPTCGATASPESSTPRRRPVRRGVRATPRRRRCRLGRATRCRGRERPTSPGLLRHRHPIRALELWARLEAFWSTRGRIYQGLERFERLADRAPDPTRRWPRPAASTCRCSAASGATSRRRTRTVGRSRSPDPSAIRRQRSTHWTSWRSTPGTRRPGGGREVLAALDRLEPHSSGRWTGCTRARPGTS